MGSQGWKTKRQDINTALDVMVRYFDGSKGILGIHEVTMTLDGAIDIHRPNWIIELEKKFEEQYGEERGVDITRKVLGALITSGQTVH